VQCEIDDRWLERWAQVYRDKMKSGGEATAFRWLQTFVPDEYKARVMVKLRTGGKQ